MKRTSVLLGIAAVALLPCLAPAQKESIPAMLSMEGTPAPKEDPKVMAVYGVSADDYIPSPQSIARGQLRPKVRSSITRPAFNLPDAFYFIGGPIFIIVFLRILVIFLNGFEEKRREELRTVAREVWDTE